MQIRAAWSIELADGQWRKNEVELTDIDLKRLLIEAGIEPTVSVTTTQAYQVLEAETQRLLMFMMISRYTVAMNTEENRAQLQAHTVKRNEILAVIKRENPTVGRAYVGGSANGTMTGVVSTSVGGAQGTAG